MEKRFAQGLPRFTLSRAGRCCYGYPIRSTILPDLCGAPRACVAPGAPPKAAGLSPTRAVILPASNKCCECLQARGGHLSVEENGLLLGAAAVEIEVTSLPPASRSDAALKRTAPDRVEDSIHLWEVLLECELARVDDGISRPMIGAGPRRRGGRWQRRGFQRLRPLYGVGSDVPRGSDDYPRFVRASPAHTGTAFARRYRNDGSRCCFYVIQRLRFAGDHPDAATANSAWAPQTRIGDAIDFVGRPESP